MTQPPVPPSTSTAPGVVRTAVPAAVGALLAWLASLGVELDPTVEGALTLAATAILGGLYYWGVRKVARRWPWAEYLLGSGLAPVFHTAATRAVIDPDSGDVVEAHIITNVPDRPGLGLRTKLDQQ